MVSPCFTMLDSVERDLSPLIEPLWSGTTLPPDKPIEHGVISKTTRFGTWARKPSNQAIHCDFPTYKEIGPAWPRLWCRLQYWNKFQRERYKQKKKWWCRISQQWSLVIHLPRSQRKGWQVTLTLECWPSAFLWPFLPFLFWFCRELWPHCGMVSHDEQLFKIQTEHKSKIRILT